MFGKKAKQRSKQDNFFRRLDGREVRYVTRRDPEGCGETILGKDGTINVFNDELNIVCKNGIVYSHPLDDLEGTDLMSLDGVVLRYKVEDTGVFDTVVAYFKYHRK